MSKNIQKKTMNSGQNDDKYEFKIIIIGNVAVGKTSILNKYLLNEFKSSYYSTVGVEFKSKNLIIDKSKVKLKIWDTCGQKNTDQ